MMKKSRIQFLNAILAFLAAEGIQLVVVFCFQIFYGLILGIKFGMEQRAKGITDASSITDKLTDSMSQDILYAISVAAVLICGIVFFFWYHYEIRGEARGSLRDTFTRKNMILLVVGGIACQFFISGMMNIVQQYFTKLFEDYSKQLEALTGGNDIVVLSLMILIAPITEELVFRGIILHKAERAIPFIGANILQAMLFGIYHMNVIQGIYAAFLGFVLGLVYHKFKTIFASILLHMIINISSLLVQFVPDNYIIYIVITIVAGTLLFGALILLLTAKSSVTEKVHLPHEF
jgi:membrane protease YdiL (CAAX protease family)